MTKPQFSAEPSMEDILASIRKMISEERMGSRPIPDQIGRSPFGESVAEPLAAGAGPRVPEPEPRPRPERAESPAERPTPSFSSLSDAIKAAAPAVDKRRSLEEKIADMLDGRDTSPSRSASLPEALAVFGAHRPASALSNEPTPFGVIPRRSSDPEPRDPEAPQASPPANADSPMSERPVSRPPEAPFNGASRRPAAPTPKGVGPAEPNKAKPNKEDSQRIIAMPHRNGAASAGHAKGVGTGLNGSGTNGSGTNGSGGNGAARGLRPIPNGSPSKGPALRDTDDAQDRKPDTAKSGSDVVTAKAPGSGKPGDLGAWPRVSETAPSVPAKAERDIKTGRETGRPETGAAVTPSETKAAEAAAKMPPRATGADKPKGSGSPSDALLDAVVAMVHKEPDTMSVFASGNAFINGVNSHDPVSAPGVPAGGKLDRSAAELLRPMLRQWLADNMPRIVEEALRSELMSAETPPKDSKES